MSTKQRVVSLAWVLFFASVIVPSVYGADWPRWRGPNGDGISIETEWDPAALAKGPRILWKTRLGTSGSNVAIQGKYLYTTGGDPRNDTIFCLDAEKGKTIWKYSYECKDKAWGAPATPTVDGDSVYTLSAEGHVHCLDARNGKVRWFTHIVNEYKVVRPRYGFAASPVVEGDLLIINVNSSGIALNKHTGKMVWQSLPVDRIADPNNSTGSEYPTPVLFTQNGIRYAIIFSDNGPHSVEVETGRQNWFFEWNPAPDQAKIADPIVFDNKVFVSESLCEGVLLDIGGGTPKVVWHNKNMRAQIITPVLISGYLYGCDGPATEGAGVLRCVDVKSGSVMWEKNLGRPVSITGANNMLLLLTDRGKLLISVASKDSYKEIANAQIFEYRGSMGPKCWSPQVLCEGRLYCKNVKGEIVCIDMRK